MKNLVFTIILIVLLCHNSQAQKSYKFYNKQDSVDYHHYSMIMSSGYKFIIEDGELKRELVDSSYQDVDNILSYDSAKYLLRKIKYFEYYTRKQNEDYTKATQLDISNQLDTITHISFEGRDLKKLPVFKLLKCKNLEEIELVNTSVKKIPWLLSWRIFGLDSLETIRIYNHSPDKRIKFKRNTNVKELVYRDNPYSPIPKNFHKLKNVKEIDFARNDFREDADFHLEKLKNLEHLNLSRNNISLSNLAKDTVHHLKFIVLSFNNLTTVPKEIGLLKDLVDLQLAENDIKSELIHPALGSLKNLEVLSFYKNDLNFVPPFIFNLEKLIELDLYYNNIEKLPEELGNLKNLEKFYIAYNRFYSIPESIGELESLKEFYIHHNRISFLPESIANLKQITDFHIHHNYFQGFPEFVLNYEKLEDLDVSFNSISQIPAEIRSLKNLRFLWMRGLVFETNSKSEAEEMQETFTILQERGVKVSIELE